MGVFDQSLDRVIPITPESLKEDGWEQISSGISLDMYGPICGKYIKNFIDGIVLCILVATINHNNELVYKLSFYNKAIGMGYDDYNELTHIDGIYLILQKYGII